MLRGARPWTVALVFAVALPLGCAAGAPTARQSSPLPTSRPTPEKPVDVAGATGPLQTPLRNPAPESIAPATLVHKDGYYVRGVDAVDGRLLAMDGSRGELRQSNDWGATWSAGKGLPSGLRPEMVNKLVRFGRYIYLLASGPSPGVWRAPPAAGSTPFAWSPQLLKLTPGSTAIMTDLNASPWGTHDFLFAAEYGDPVGGPSIWRIGMDDADGLGLNWIRSYGPDGKSRHIHGVAADPYIRGDVWATIGDGGPTTLAFSNDYGETWTRVIGDYSWQAVQISFDPRYVYLAGDQPTFSYGVLDRATLTPQIAAPNRPADLEIPGLHAAGDRYYAIAYFGSVDPATGIYYCVANDSSSAGNRMGMFYARRLGERIRILDPGGVDINMNGEILIAHGTIYSGVWQHPALAAG